MSENMRNFADDMKVSSFDIFDTCLLRKCGTPENFFDVFSLRAFDGEVEEWARQEFVAARHIAAEKTYSRSVTLQDIWNAFTWTHPQLKSKDKLYLLEQDLERELLVPVLSMRDKVNECRINGDKIIFISDMYLSSAFLIDVMREHGFYQDGDSLYVSCECNATKRDGALYEYVHDKEHISFRKWHHYGDNKYGDYKIPRKLGIRSTLINHEYTPYQQQWVNNDYSLGYKYPSVLAGLGRALHYSTEWNTHTDFVLDIIAPFYCSLVYRIMKDAEQRGIRRLYFCARDAYMMYKIALKYSPLFPHITSTFLYISKTALYEGNPEARLRYFEQIGLATKTENVAIVDFRSSGKTLCFLNDFLQREGYCIVRGYYFEMFCIRDLQHIPKNYYHEANTLYAEQNSTLKRFFGYWHIYENLFPLNTLQRTINYRIVNDVAEPVFDEAGKEALETDIFTYQDNEYWSKEHCKLIEIWTDVFITLQLYRFSNEMWQNIIIPTLVNFFETPLKQYLPSLENLWCGKWEDNNFELYPYVQKQSLFQLLINRGRNTIWRRGTLIYSIPEWLYPIVDKIIH